MSYPCNGRVTVQSGYRSELLGETRSCWKCRAGTTKQQPTAMWTCWKRQRGKTSTLLMRMGWHPPFWQPTTGTWKLWKSFAEGGKWASPHCLKPGPQNYSYCLMFLTPWWPQAQNAENRSIFCQCTAKNCFFSGSGLGPEPAGRSLHYFLRQGLRSSSGVLSVKPHGHPQDHTVCGACREQLTGAGAGAFPFLSGEGGQQHLRISWERIYREMPNLKKF